jgi:hypothetical protein
MDIPSRSAPSFYNYSRDSCCCCPVLLGYECQGHSAVVDMVELQQVRQMPTTRPRTVVDEREDRNDSMDDKLSSGVFGCY